MLETVSHTLSHISPDSDITQPLIITLPPPNLSVSLTVYGSNFSVPFDLILFTFIPPEKITLSQVYSNMSVLLREAMP